LLLEDEDLTSAVDYTRNMMRLMFRSLFGCGVICGLDVKARLTCNGTRVEATIGKGVALSCMGDPIEIPTAFPITYDAKCDPLPHYLWVVVCYRDVCCGPRDISCAPDDEGHRVPTRIRDGFEVRIYSKQPKCACSCEPPPEDGGKKHRGCCDDEDEEEETSSAPSTATSTAKQQSKQAAVMAGPYDAQGGLIETTLTEPVTPPTLPVPEKPKLPELCDCYEDHFNGKCDCECCCPCVFIGKIDTTLLDDGKTPVDPKKLSEPQSLYVDRQWIRWIRPVLVGYYKCLKAVSSPVVVPKTVTPSKGKGPKVALPG
jgi:hypothetical protein